MTGFTNSEEEVVSLTNVVSLLLEDRLKERAGDWSEQGLIETRGRGVVEATDAIPGERAHAIKDL